MIFLINLEFNNLIQNNVCAQKDFMIFIKLNKIQRAKLVIIAALNVQELS